MKKIHAYDAILFTVFTLVFHVFQFEVIDVSALYLSRVEIWVVFAVCIGSIFANVLPKYMKFGGAKRHFSDTTSHAERRFLSKNYLRLFMHIISGITSSCVPPMFLLYEDWCFSLMSYKSWVAFFVFWDTIHQFTIWLMTRNHDGVFAGRVYNFSFGVVKLFICVVLAKQAEYNDMARSCISAIFLLTSGFAWTRVTCFIVAMGQLFFLNSDFTIMRENWYSFGLVAAHAGIGIRIGILRELNWCILFTVYYFPHELWTRSAKIDHKRNCLYLALCFLPFCMVEREVIQLLILVAFEGFTSFFCGAYYKRDPIVGLDDTEAEIEDGKKNQEFLKRGSTYGNLDTFWAAVAKASKSLATHTSGRVSRTLSDIQRSINRLEAAQRSSGRIASSNRLPSSYGFTHQSMSEKKEILETFVRELASTQATRADGNSLKSISISETDVASLLVLLETRGRRSSMRRNTLRNMLSRFSETDFDLPPTSPSSQGRMKRVSLTVPAKYYQPSIEELKEAETVRSVDQSPKVSGGKTISFDLNSDNRTPSERALAA